MIKLLILSLFLYPRLHVLSIIHVQSPISSCNWTYSWIFQIHESVKTNCCNALQRIAPQAIAFRLPITPILLSFRSSSTISPSLCPLLFWKQWVLITYIPSCTIPLSKASRRNSFPGYCYPFLLNFTFLPIHATFFGTSRWYTRQSYICLPVLSQKAGTQKLICSMINWTVLLTILTISRSTHLQEHCPISLNM